jgi:hypothetical protein
MTPPGTPRLQQLLHTREAQGVVLGPRGKENCSLMGEIHKIAQISVASARSQPFQLPKQQGPVVFLGTGLR